MCDPSASVLFDLCIRLYSQDLHLTSLTLPCLSRCFLKPQFASTSLLKAWPRHREVTPLSGQLLWKLRNVRFIVCCFQVLYAVLICYVNIVLLFQLHHDLRYLVPGLKYFYKETLYRTSLVFRQPLEYLSI